jgi:regulator of protease activity HflC (stomatin/prohibitin superfamily)
MPLYFCIFNKETNYKFNTMGYTILLIPLFLFAFFILISGIFTVKQQTSAIVERFGRFLAVRNSGLRFKIPLVDRISGRINLKIQQLDVLVETKTKDDVFVRLKISVQFQVLKQKVYDAFYKLENPHDQITSYVFDVVRAEVPKMKLDDVFERKDDVAIAVKTELNEAMINYGYDIIKTLVTDIDPDVQVKAAMNRINAAEREKVAAEYEAEAERIKIVAKARAEAESKRLQGQGIADQRREIARGLEESVDVLNNVGINSQEASALIVVTQHYDTLQSIGEHTQSNLILLPNSPQAGSNMLNDMIASFVASNQIGEQMKVDNIAKGITNKKKRTPPPKRAEEGDDLNY